MSGGPGPESGARGGGRASEGDRAGAPADPAPAPGPAAHGTSGSPAVSPAAPALRPTTPPAPAPQAPSQDTPASPPRRGVAAHPALLRWLVLVVAVGVWEWAARARGSVYVPPPGRIVRHARDLWFSGPPRHAFLTPAAVDDVLASLGRLAAGFVLAAGAGVALGVAVGRSRWAYALCNPVLQFARAVPPPALVPVFVVVFSFGTPMQIASIAFSAVWPVLINTAAGVRNTDPLRLDVAAVLRLNSAERLWFLVLPSALPRVFAGLRLSLSLSLILMVFSELLPGTANGIGFTLTEAQTRSDLLTVWSVLVLLGVLGYLLNTGLLTVERLLLGRGRPT
ncbi:ABC transporter permease [Streptomyces sp. NPDC050287]|uniref:ABC transporter permease n=1 Tax=Streptomyces sp. NPDC050287 TaxID=3365608 RepID=UPI003797B3D0